MIVKGSIIELVKVIGGFDFVGDKFEVVEVTDTTVVFKHSSLGLGVMSFTEMMEYFKEVVDEWSAWTPVTEEQGMTEIIVLWTMMFTEVTDFVSEWQFRTKGTEVEVRNTAKPLTIGRSKSSSEDSYNLETGIQAALLKAHIKCLDEELRVSKQLLEEYVDYEKVDYSQCW